MNGNPQSPSRGASTRSRRLDITEAQTGVRLLALCIVSVLGGCAASDGFVPETYSPDAGSGVADDASAPQPDGVGVDTGGGPAESEAVALESRDACLFDEMCAAGTHCFSNRCVYACLDAAECASDETCDGRGRCVPGDADSDASKSFEASTVELQAFVELHSRSRIAVEPGMSVYVDVELHESPESVPYRIRRTDQPGSTYAGELYQLEPGRSLVEVNLPFDAELPIYVELESSAGTLGFELHAKPPQAGRYGADIHFHTPASVTMPVTFDIELEPEGATFQNATRRYLQLGTAPASPLSGPRADGGGQPRVELVETEDGYEAEFRYDVELDESSPLRRLEGRSRVVRSLRFNVETFETRTIGGTVVDEWYGLYDDAVGPTRTRAAGRFVAYHDGPVEEGVPEFVLREPTPLPLAQRSDRLEACETWARRMDGYSRSSDVPTNCSGLSTTGFDRSRSTEDLLACARSIVTQTPTLGTCLAEGLSPFCGGLANPVEEAPEDVLQMVAACERGDENCGAPRAFACAAELSSEVLSRGGVQAGQAAELLASSLSASVRGNGFLAEARAAEWMETWLTSSEDDSRLMVELLEGTVNPRSERLISAFSPGLVGALGAVLDDDLDSGRVALWEQTLELVELRTDYAERVVASGSDALPVETAHWGFENWALGLALASGIGDDSGLEAWAGSLNAFIQATEYGDFRTEGVLPIVTPTALDDPRATLAIRMDAADGRLALAESEIAAALSTLMSERDGLLDAQDSAEAEERAILDSLAALCGTDAVQLDGDGYPRVLLSDEECGLEVVDGEPLGEGTGSRASAAFVALRAAAQTITIEQAEVAALEDSADATLAYAEGLESRIRERFVVSMQGEATSLSAAWNILSLRHRAGKVRASNDRANGALEGAASIGSALASLDPVEVIGSFVGLCTRRSRNQAAQRARRLTRMADELEWRRNYEDVMRNLQLNLDRELEQVERLALDVQQATIRMAVHSQRIVAAEIEFEAQLDALSAVYAERDRLIARLGWVRAQQDRAMGRRFSPAAYATAVERLTTAARELEEARRSALAALDAAEYAALRTFPRTRDAIAHARRPDQLRAALNDLRYGIAVECGYPESAYTRELSVRADLLSLAGPIYDPVTTRTLSAADQLRSVLDEHVVLRSTAVELLDAGLWDIVSADAGITDDLWAVTVSIPAPEGQCDAKLRSVSLSLVGDLGRAEPIVGVVADGGALSVSCQPPSEGQSREVALRGPSRAVAIPAGVNEAGQPSLGFDQVPVGSRLTLFIDRSRAGNEDVDWGALEDIILHLEYTAGTPIPRSQACTE